MPLLDRFLKYVAINTQSRDNAHSTPSSPGQTALASLLAAELAQLDIPSHTLSPHAYLTAHLPGRHQKPDAPTIGLIAHLDTALETPGENVSPRIIENYDGAPIDLGNSLRLDPAAFPVLDDKIGKTLVVADGHTLLGADDKAGIAVIMTVLEELRDNPEIPHPPLAIAFTPDEEIGHGAALLDLEAFGADFAYTVDGGGLATIEYENFNAAEATITIRGLAIHPGEAKDRMINATLLGQALLDALPADQRPENTEKRQGFYHVLAFEGDVSSARAALLVRDHDSALFQARKDFLEKLVSDLNARWPAPPDETPRFTLTLRDQYRNMVEKIRPRMHIVDNAKDAMRSLGLTPEDTPIRGGTDGAQLSWRGLPCPNLFDGSYNVHGPYEFAVVEEMRLAVDTILGILARY